MRILAPLCIACLLLLSQNGTAQRLTYPQFTVSVDSTASTGYYFFCVTRPPSPTGADVNMILDSVGNVVYYRVFLGAGAGDFKLLPDKRMVYNRLARFVLMDSTFSVVDTVTFRDSLAADIHDFLVLPNGNYLMMGLETVVMDLSGYTMGNGNPGKSDASVQCGVIREMDPEGDVVFEWHAKDHFAFDEADSTYLNSSSNVDWTHFNAIHYDTDGNILLSTRHFNEITKINRHTGEVMWRLGGKKNQFIFIDDIYPAPQFLGQHTVSRTPDGNILLYDDGRSGLPHHPATAKEYKLDEAGRTATLVWHYVEDSNAYSTAMGSAQRLSNGTTVICYGAAPALEQAFNAVKPSGEKVFEIRFTNRLRCYRASNYPVLPWQLNRPQITCLDSAGEHYLDAGPGHDAYIWSNGDTTRTTHLTANDTLLSVFVPRGDSGWISSEPFRVQSPLAPCGLSSVEPTHTAPPTLTITSPVTDRLQIELSTHSDGLETVEISDVAGRVVHTGRYAPIRGAMTIPLPKLPTGVYFVRCGEAGGRFVVQ